MSDSVTVVKTVALSQDSLCIFFIIIFLLSTPHAFILSSPLHAKESLSGPIDLAASEAYACMTHPTTAKFGALYVNST